jgi:P pilus assembly chaperone PapD
MVTRARVTMAAKHIPTKPKIWLFLLVMLILGFSISSCSAINPTPFAMAGGDEQLVVLLRNEKDGHYQVRYEGRNPTQLNSLKVMLGGQILHVDIAQVAINHNGQEIILQGNGMLPEGSQVTLAPGDEFEVRVTYLGQTLGGNYMYGFRIGSGDDPQAEPWDLIAEFDYAVIVE